MAELAAFLNSNGLKRPNDLMKMRSPVESNALPEILLKVVETTPQGQHVPRGAKLMDLASLERQLCGSAVGFPSSPPPPHHVPLLYPLGPPRGTATTNTQDDRPKIADQIAQLLKNPTVPREPTSIENLLGEAFRKYREKKQAELVGMASFSPNPLTALFGGGSTGHPTIAAPAAVGLLSSLYAGSSGLPQISDEQSAFYFEEDEERFGAENDPSHYLYIESEAIRRLNPVYYEAAEQFFDLNIVMPISIESATVVVDVESCDHYYAFKPITTQEGLRPHPAQMLFGRGVPASTSGPNGSNCTPSPPKDQEDQSSPDKMLKLRLPSEADDPTAYGPSACDTWSSFLNVRLGTVYNVKADQLRMVCELFKKSFDTSLCKFLVPIQFECRGIYPAPDSSIASTAQTKGNNRGAKHHRRVEKYETVATPLTLNDSKRFLMVRRHLKIFANRLIHHFGCAGFGKLYPFQQSSPQSPRLHVELHGNCKSTSFETGMRCVIREWTKLTNHAAIKQIWRGLGEGGSGFGNQVVRDTHCTVQCGEIRLEHINHRMVDPRWPNKLILGRRVADHNPMTEPPDSPETQARWVFFDRLTAPEVIYRKQFRDFGDDPPASIPKTPEELREIMIKGRYGHLIQHHINYFPFAGLPRSSHETQVQSVRAALSLPGEKGFKDVTVEQGVRPQLPAALQKLVDNQVSCAQTALLNAPLPRTPYQRNTTDSSEIRTPLNMQRPNTAENAFGSLPSLSPVKTSTVSAAQKTTSVCGLNQSSAFRGQVTNPYTNAKARRTLGAEVPCRFFMQGNCGKGGRCPFLHPVDKRLEYTVDIRDVPPQHPRFFP